MEWREYNFDAIYFASSLVPYTAHSQLMNEGSYLKNKILI